MTDPYAETDEWPTTPATRPHGKDHPMNHPENQQQIAQRRSRNATYAEAIRKNLAIPEEIGRWANVLAEVVTPVADQETADLRAEVESMRRADGAAAAEPTPSTGERIDWSNTVLVLRQLAQTIGSTPKGTVPVAAVVDTLDQVADRLLSGEFPPAASSVDDKEGER